jgi:hypothetical protein
MSRFIVDPENSRILPIRNLGKGIIAYCKEQQNEFYLFHNRVGFGYKNRERILIPPFGKW